MKGQIVKVHSNNYYVSVNGDTPIKCSARGLLKLKKTEILVGDFVDFENGVINKIHQRKNSFIRPSVANVDVMAIVVGFEPAPDYYLIDKLLINAELTGVEKILIVNKADAGEELFNSLKDEYSKAFDKFFSVSALSNIGIDELKSYLSGKFTVFAGQSAVGKTSLINSIFGFSLKTGDLSEKIVRGKHTTTYSAIHGKGDLKIIDSPGFAVIDATPEKDDLKYCYPDFSDFEGKCKFRGCVHISEPDCAIKQAVEKGLINENRYKRYLEIYKEVLERGKLYAKY